MGIFADKTKAATRLLVAQLPSVTIEGTKCHVQKFGGQMDFFEARGRAEEILNLQGKYQIGNLVLAMATVQVALSRCLVDADGRKIAEDNDDIQALMDAMRKDADLQKQISDLSGFTEYIDSLKTNEASTTTEQPEMTLEEAALGNSEPSSPQE